MEKPRKKRLPVPYLSKKKRRSVSISSLGTFLRCPAQYFFQYYSGSPKLTDYPRLCGVKVHSFIQRLEVGNKKFPRETWSDPRRFYFTELEKALNAWSREWKISVTTFTRNGKLINPNNRDTFRFNEIGKTCISNYWNTVSNLNLPLEVERAYRFPWRETGVDLNGHIDQVRAANLDYVRAKRPELFKGNELHPDFAPVIILDFKTGWDSFSQDNAEETSLQKMMRNQFSLHFDIQATAYSWLYFKHTGKWPVGFWFNYLRTNSVYFTHRDGFPETPLGRRSLAELNALVVHLLDSENSESYPRHVNKSNCSSCDYINVCLGQKHFTIASAEKISGIPLDPTTLQINVKKRPRKLRLKLKVERVKREPPEINESIPEVVIRRDLPWREELEEI